MKSILSAVAVSLALGSAAAQANEQTFPDGYRALTAEQAAPRAGAVAADVLVNQFPQPSFVDYTVLPQDASPASTGSSAEILAKFPQPSSIAN